jgi:hypothetical protein
MQEALVKIAKKLKKNNVAVDVVSFGSEEANSDRLEAFHAAVNSNDNSHLVTVPPGTILSDMLFGTPIFMEEGAGGGGGGGEEGGAPAPRSECASVRHALQGSMLVAWHLSVGHILIAGALVLCLLQFCQAMLWMGLTTASWAWIPPWTLSW